jgi:hypothetical protein
MKSHKMTGAYAEKDCPLVSAVLSRNVTKQILMFVVSLRFVSFNYVHDYENTTL